MGGSVSWWEEEKEAVPMSYSELEVGWVWVDRKADVGGWVGGWTTYLKEGGRVVSVDEHEEHEEDVLGCVEG